MAQASSDGGLINFVAWEWLVVPDGSQPRQNLLEGREDLVLDGVAALVGGAVEAGAAE